MARDERFVEGCQFRMDNLKCKYVYTKEPDVYVSPQGHKGDPNWKATIVLDDHWKSELMNAGFNVKQDKDGDWTLTVKRKVNIQGGKTQEPPTVVDANKNPFNELIGNGSVCNFIIYGKYNNPKDINQVCAYLNAIQVIEHVPYTSGNGVQFDAVDSPF